MMKRFLLGFQWVKDCYCQWLGLIKAKPEIIDVQGIRCGIFWILINQSWK